MKKTVTAIALIAALTIGIIGVASSATAVPAKRKSCSACHHTSRAVKIGLTKTAETSTTATYKIKVTGGKGRAGWAVLNGKTNVKHKTASTGSFTVNKGTTYKVWAVKKGSGAKSKALAAK